MARIRTTADELTVELTPGERAWSLRAGDVRVPRSSVRSATVQEDALAQVHGLRAPGLALPGRVKVGTWRGRWGKDLVVVRREQPAVVVDLTGAPWRRLVVSCADRAQAEQVVRELVG